MESKYLDNTKGLRPAPNEESFNNIVYSTQYIIGLDVSHSIEVKELDNYFYHLSATNDEHGLYRPKNSHDNITMKLVGSKYFRLRYHKEFSLPQAIKSIGPRPECILYSFWSNNKLIKLLSKPLLFIVALQCLDGISKSEKVRPEFFERLDWMFKDRDLVKVVTNPTFTTKTWRLNDGTIKETRHMQSDGKHLAPFKLFILKNESWLMRQVAIYCDKKLTKELGPCYMHEIFKRYYHDQNHPNILLYKNIRNFIMA